MDEVYEVIDETIDVVPGTRIFTTADDQLFVVDADLTQNASKPTAVIFCNQYGVFDYLNADDSFAPAATAEEVIADLGYTLIEQV